MYVSCANVDICYRHTFIPASPYVRCHSMWNGSLTVEWNTTPCSIFASPILCHTFVRPRVFLLEIRDFKDAIWFLHLDFAGERDAAGSPPAYVWDRAAKDEQEVPKMATVSRSDQSVIKHRRKVVEARALWIIVPHKSKLWLLRFQKLLKELWFLLLCLLIRRPLLSYGLMNLRMSNVTLVHP